jgi:DNA-binding MarR family transcriptional regulator
VAVRFHLDNQLLRAWVLLHQAHNLITKAEDAVYARIGLTTQHQAVLLAMKYIEGPTTISVIARWLDRNTNTITTLVDRMEKAGLVKRLRDMPDRRSVRLVMTEEGKKASDQATVLGWQLLQDILQDLSEEQLQSLCELLEAVRGKALDYLKPVKDNE